MCFKTFIWKRPYNKKYREQSWFKLWVKESFCVRQLCDLSGYSKFKLESIKNHWLEQLPNESFDFSQYPYVIYDATYFHQDGCFMSLMNVLDQKIISHRYADKEGFRSACPWFEGLRKQGLNPNFITMDGERSVMRAIQIVWPETTVQRCLRHIQREGMRWLRSHPKTQAARELRRLLKDLCGIRSVKEQNRFIEAYKSWLSQYNDFAASLPSSDFAFRDLKRTIVLINNALPDMFHYLKDPNIPHTTNTLESFHSRLKADYQRHRGLTTKRKLNYLSWYCYFKNQ